MANLLAQTRKAMGESDLNAEDITFIGSEESGHRCTWDEYVTLADREYDDGYGGAEVAGDLLIIFKDGSRMERGEYDGSEWWEVRRPFVEPATKRPISSLFRFDYESTLADIQDAAAEVDGGSRG